MVCFVGGILVAMYSRDATIYIFNVICYGEMSQHVVRHDISLHQSMPIISVIISNIKCFCLNTDIDINNIAIMQ